MVQPIRVSPRELLGHGTSERHAEHIDAIERERVDEAGGLAGESTHAPGHQPGRGCPRSRCVVADRLEATADQGALQRIPHLDVSPEPHDEQQWSSLTLDRHPDQVIAHLDQRGSVCQRSCT